MGIAVIGAVLIQKALLAQEQIAIKLDYAFVASYLYVLMVQEGRKLGESNG
jgi:hypothetical protein